MSNGTGDSGRPDGETPVAATPRSDHNPRATEEGDRGPSGSAGDWGFGPGWNATHSQPTGVAENPALQKAADQIADAFRRAHEPHLGQPLNPHEQGPGSNFGHDPAHPGGTHANGSDGNGFAELIRMAQNPNELGLTAPSAPAAHDPGLHLALAPDALAHGPAAHGVEDIHAAIQPALVPGHDVHLDQHALATPALDHITTVHH